MPVWLGAALAGVFAVISGYRTHRRELPAALMAAGMAIMALSMGGIGPHLVHGPWWALGFAVVALWSALWSARWSALWSARWSALGERADPSHWRLPTLVGGVAMVYMCAPAPAVVGTTVASARLDGGHQHVPAAGLVANVPGSAGAEALALAGWGLAGYFLLAALAAMTRHAPDGRVRRSGTDMAEASSALGTMVMLVAMA